MARRSGKAASRRSRQQRRAQRAQQHAQSVQPSPQRDAGSAAPAGDELTAAHVDAFEKADAELRASTPPPGTRATAPAAPRRSVRARTSDFNVTAGSSRLTERAAAEYHYVGRDLRNIAVLLVVMAVLLAASAIAVTLLGIGAAA